MEVFCTPGAYIKSDEGTIHSSNVRGVIDLYRIDYYIKERMVSGALSYKHVMDNFSVEKSTLKSHDIGIITEDSLLKIMCK